MRLYGFGLKMTETECVAELSRLYERMVWRRVGVWQWLRDGLLARLKRGARVMVSDALACCR